MRKVALSALAWIWLWFTSSQWVEAQESKLPEISSSEIVCSQITEEQRSECQRILECWGELMMSYTLNSDGNISIKGSLVKWINTDVCLFYKKDEPKKKQEKSLPKKEFPDREHENPDIYDI